MTEDRFSRLEQRVDQIVNDLAIVKGQMQYVKSVMERNDKEERKPPFDWAGFGKFIAQIVAAAVAGHFGGKT